ncbi:MAG: MATE family efflux transporter [Burkholderiaceae bacterium]|nr:MATE family efflux transporter [Burkholderiaceae bacterium]
MSAPATLLDSLKRIAPLAWPVFIGQVAVLAFSTLDTMLVARYAAVDLAALSVGSAVYITVFIGLMGVVLALSPIAGQMFGAKKLHEAGRQYHQAIWLALALSVPGCLVLMFPGPFLNLAQASPEVAGKVRGYLGALAFSLPAALLFTAFRAFNTAVSRPKAVMVLQLGGLAMKVPLSLLFVYGFTIDDLHLPALGVAGCGIATAIVMWSQVLLAWWVTRHNAFYADFGLQRGGLMPPDRAAIINQLRLGIPMGFTVLVEVTGFSFMAIFIARIGATAVAGHQIAVNLVSLLFMMPLALANATSTLVAQRIGAHEMLDARRVGWHGLEIGLLAATLLGGLVYFGRDLVLGVYTQDPAVIAAALPLLAWLWVFHIADAAQTLGAFILRAHRVTTLPSLIYVLALWGVGLGGGYVLAFHSQGWAPATLWGARGMWAASTAGLVLAGISMCALLARVHRAELRHP